MRSSDKWARNNDENDIYSKLELQWKEGIEYLKRFLSKKI